MPLDLHRLRIFAAIAHAGSFTRAAEQLAMAQPTVSQQLALLEQAIGAPLIDRGRRRLRLTEAGAVLLPYAERMLATAAEALEAARTAAGQADRTLRLAVGHTLATYLLPDLLRRYRMARPDVIVRVSAGNTTTLLELLVAGSVDLALVGTPADHPQITLTEFRRDTLVVIVAPDDPWARRKQVDIAELHTRLLLIREPGSALHASLLRLMGSEALSGDGVIVLGETEAIKRCVEAGVGIAVVQGIAIEREVRQRVLNVLTLHGADVQRQYMVARRTGTPPSPAAAALLHELGV